MGRSYAGTLGPLALLVTLGRGWLAGSGVESTVFSAWLAFLMFAGIGYVCGELADWVVRESVSAKLASQLEQQAATAEPKIST